MTNNEIILEAVKTAFSAEQIHTMAAAHHSAEQLASMAAHIKTKPDKNGNTTDPLQIAEAMAVAGMFHTYNEWKQQGLQVKRGEKAALAVSLWRFTDKPSAAQRKAMAEAKAAQAIGPAEQKLVDDHPNDPHYYKKLSYLFHRDQVEVPTERPAVHVKTAEEIRAYNAQLAAQRKARRAAAAQQSAPVVIAQTAHKDLQDNTTETSVILAVPQQLDFSSLAANVLA